MSTVASSSRGMLTGINCTSSGSASQAASVPTTAPPTDSTLLSASSCTTSWRGEAPIATRTAISFSRDSARVSSSEATLRQPITSKMPTAPNSTISAGR